MQLTALFRVEERSVAFVCEPRERLPYDRAHAPPRGRLREGRAGRDRRELRRHAVVYLTLLGYRREQLGLQFDRGLLREMNRFGIPLVPTALFLWVTNFSDRFFLVKLADVAEAGLYSVGVRIASAMVLLLTAFRLAWPAFAYSIEDEHEARQTYAYVLTYLTVVTAWVALALTLLSPWIVDLLAADEFAERHAWSGRWRSRPSRTAAHRRRDRRRTRAPDAVQLGRDRARRRSSTWPSTWR